MSPGVERTTDLPPRTVGLLSCPAGNLRAAGTPEYTVHEVWRQASGRVQSSSRAGNQAWARLARGSEHGQVEL